MRKLKILLVGLFSLTLAYPAFAGTNIYKDTYTKEDSSGNWRFNGNVNATQGTLTYREGVQLITAPSDTTGTVTLDESGYNYILTASAGPTVGGVGYTLTLPTAASGLTYTFTTATNQTLSVRSASANDLMLWGTAVNKTRFTSPASTGCTITVVGSSGKWFVTDMVTPADGPGSVHNDWTAGTL